ncbi:MAG: hypothetical protein UT55_C0066G0005 [Candidatus Peregrinibacteria bacterium GW2011_GWE2_39_6]|nr:MAG: hypothetical protein UT36_C0007G0020 [Candidatus Peregrinibacteria bacterium GW2011_GWF2_39_17]KKR24310.1 MAG: hypothetical protein UT55_C0066G0005 [Candidatus Peregrinibacteria bacterium GW2011_GWE2_39_6]
MKPPSDGDFIEEFLKRKSPSLAEKGAFIRHQGITQSKPNNP